MIFPFDAQGMSGYPSDNRDVRALTLGFGRCCCVFIRTNTSSAMVSKGRAGPNSRGARCRICFGDSMK